MGREEDKTSWGAQIVDYEKIATAALQAMKAADLNRFFVVCALVSDLYCPGYNPRQPTREKLEPCSHGGTAQGRFSKDRRCCPGGAINKEIWKRWTASR